MMGRNPRAKARVPVPLAGALYVEAARYRLVAKAGSQNGSWGFVDTEDTMLPRTIFLSRLLGLSSLVIGLAMIAHRQATIETIRAMVHNGPAMYLSGVIALAAGL